MSNSSNENAGLIMGASIVLSGMLIIGGVIFAAALFLSLAYTGLCFAAWNRPITAFGETITPEEARAFVKRGVIGALLLPAFVMFAAALFEFRVAPDAWMFLALGGYTLGSIGIEYQLQKEKLEAAQAVGAQLVLPPAPPAKPEPPMDMYRLAKPPAEPAPFRFASWNDEEELRS